MLESATGRAAQQLWEGAEVNPSLRSVIITVAVVLVFAGLLMFLKSYGEQRSRDFDRQLETNEQHVRDFQKNLNDSFIECGGKVC